MAKFFKNLDVKNLIKSTSYDKKKLMIVICIMIGILMMMMSGFVNGGEKNIKKIKDKEFDVGIYEQELELRLLNIVEGIKGVGKADIMVTLENSLEYVYAQEKRAKKDMINDYQANMPLKIEERNDEERKMMLVDGPNGHRHALIKTELQPKVKGVVVVCQGGDNSFVCQQVTNLITTVLNISSNKVYVTKSNK